MGLVDICRGYLSDQASSLDPSVLVDPWRKSRPESQPQYVSLEKNQEQSTLATGSAATESRLALEMDCNLELLSRAVAKGENVHDEAD